MQYTDRSVEVYSVWMFVAETGGWIGLFLGISILDIADYLINFVVKTSERTNNCEAEE